jgi:hypothetical protein
MGKISKMATETDCIELSKRILKLKDTLGLTYKELNVRLERPCTASTLQIRATHPNKGCSLNLFNKIDHSIKKLDSTAKEVEDTRSQITSLRDAAIEDITRIFDEHIAKIEDVISNKYR